MADKSFFVTQRDLVDAPIDELKAQQAELGKALKTFTETVKKIFEHAEFKCVLNLGLVPLSSLRDDLDAVVASIRAIDPGQDGDHGSSPLVGVSTRDGEGADGKL